MNVFFGNVTMKSLLLAVFLSVGIFSAWDASAMPIRVLGDGEPFPVACADFGGRWRSDKGQTYAILQRGCGWMQIHKTTNDGVDQLTTIVPDGKSRNIAGSAFTGTVIDKWNDPSFGATVQTNRTMLYSDRKITEFVTLEDVNKDLILESTYRVTEFLDGRAPTQTDYSQQVFRHADSSAPAAE